jgi:16S rRNA C967 or C1407 C5-methylase (RsmB/RsmF family)/NOL1/NOP2/fmu family ribosome biogenesis protein
MRQMLGVDFPAFQHSLAEPAPVSIRLNPLKDFSLSGRPVPWAAHGLYLDARPVFTLDPAFHAGAYYVQEASSMFLEHLIRQLNLHQKPIRVLDAAAAPGGKSTLLVSVLHPESLLVANEVIRSRVPLLQENLTRWGHPNTIITSNDPQHFSALEGFFDVVVLDAPCSGEGLFRKDPEAQRQWSPEHVQHCARRQQRIVHHLWPALKPGGIFIYSTCTYNTLENEEIIRALVEHHRAEALAVALPPEWNIVHNNNPLPTYRFYPHRVQGEGFCVAVLQKPQGKTSMNVKTTAHPERLPRGREFASYLQAPFEMSYLRFKAQAVAFPASLSQVAAWLVQKLNVINLGTALAKEGKSKAVPQHALAMSVYLNQPAFQSINLNYQQAIAYLRKEPVTEIFSQKGFCLVKFNHLPLGWINVLPGRVNNLYPSEWRIRMPKGG